MEPDSKLLKSVRAGHKGAITKLLKKFDDNGSDFEEEDLLTLIDTLSVKRDILATVNEKIIQQTTEEDIAEEIADSDEYLFDLDRKIRKIKKLAKSCTQEKVLNQMQIISFQLRTRKRPASTTSHFHRKMQNARMRTLHFSRRKAFRLRNSPISRPVYIVTITNFGS